MILCWLPCNRKTFINATSVYFFRHAIGLYRQAYSKIHILSKIDPANIPFPDKSFMIQRISHISHDISMEHIIALPTSFLKQAILRLPNGTFSHSFPNDPCDYGVVRFQRTVPRTNAAGNATAKLCRGLLQTHYNQIIALLYKLFDPAIDPKPQILDLFNLQNEEGEIIL